MHQSHWLNNLAFKLTIKNTTKFHIGTNVYDYRCNKKVLNFICNVYFALTRLKR